MFFDANFQLRIALPDQQKYRKYTSILSYTK